MPHRVRLNNVTYEKLVVALNQWEKVTKQFEDKNCTDLDDGSLTDQMAGLGWVISDLLDDVEGDLGEDHYVVVASKALWTHEDMTSQFAVGIKALLSTVEIKVL